MEDSSRDLTIFVCPFGRFRFQRMPFELKALIERVLSSCKDFSAVYIDDILIFSNSWSEHLCHVRKVFAGSETGRPHSQA